MIRSVPLCAALLAVAVSASANHISEVDGPDRQRGPEYDSGESSGGSAPDEEGGDSSQSQSQPPARRRGVQPSPPAGSDPVTTPPPDPTPTPDPGDGADAGTSPAGGTPTSGGCLPGVPNSCGPAAPPPPAPGGPTVPQAPTTFPEGAAAPAPSGPPPAPSDARRISEGQRQIGLARESATDAISRALAGLRSALGARPASPGAGGASGAAPAADASRRAAGPAQEAAVLSVPLLGKGVSLQPGRPLAQGPAIQKTSAEHALEAGRKLAGGDLDAAIEAATRALELEPANTRALVRRAEAYNRLKRYDLAHADALAALKQDPRNVRALQNKAWAEFKRGDTKQALATIEQAMALSHDPANALIRAYIRDQSGDRAGALADLRLAARLDPRLSDLAADYADGGQIFDPFDQTTLTLASRKGFGRGASAATILWGAGALALLLAGAWLAGRRSRDPELFTREGLRRLLADLRGESPDARAKETGPAPSAHPVWARARTRLGGSAQPPK